MSSVAEPIPSPGTFDQRWAWGVRIAALICILPPWVQYAQSRMDPCVGFTTFWFWISLAWTVIYLSVVFIAVSRRRVSKGGLSWAANTGLSWFAISILVLGLLVLTGELAGGLPWTALALGSALLAVSAVKTYRSAEPEARVKTILFGKLGVSLTCVILECILMWLLSVAWGPLSLLVTPNHRATPAVGDLRTINTAEVTYSSEYHQGFSPNLRTLGPPSGSAQPDAGAADFIDTLLASGAKLGYTFNYLPGPRDSTGRVTTYSISAHSSSAGYNSYYTDESGVVRFTEENRTAGAKDPPFTGCSDLVQ